MGKIIGNPIDQNQTYNKNSLNNNNNELKFTVNLQKRSFHEWWNTVPIDLRKKAIDVQNNNNSNSLIQKINYILLQLPNKDLKPSLEELQYWINTNQI